MLFRDHFTESGIVHAVDKVITPATRTLGEIVSQDVQFSTLSKLLQETGLMERLDNAEGQLTLFAPTETAFKKLNEEEKVIKQTTCSLLKLSTRLNSFDLTTCFFRQK